MNERIKQLAERNGFVHEWQSPGEQRDILKNLERFAELIVREVFVKIEDERFEVYQPVKESVMKHFGVEE